MLPFPSSPVPARARTLPRTAIGVLVIGGLVAGVLASVAAAGPADAAATTGTFPVGATTIRLNQPVDPDLGRITPTADAAQNGMFGAQFDWPIVPLHAAVARNGNLVTWGTPVKTEVQQGSVYDVWTPMAGFGTTAHKAYGWMHEYDSFCNAFTELPDGRLLMVGGNSATTTMLFDPATGAQTMGQNISHQRWYGTSLRLTDGRVLLLGGSDTYNSNAYLTPEVTAGVARTPEIGTGTGAWTDLPGAASDVAFGLAHNRWWYPRAFNGPHGDVVGSSSDQLWTLSTEGGGAVTEVGTLPFNPGVSGSQVMYAPGRELIAGGGQDTNDDDLPATNAAAVVDWSGATPTVTSVPPMASPRNWLNLTVLPNGEVLADGGTKVGNVGHDWTNAVRQAEIWNPTTRTWRTAATAARTRSYHATSVVLPSGAVFTGGGGIPGPETNFNAELYYPAYLFTTTGGKVHWASRPAITGISGSATHGGTVALTIADGRTIGSAALISLPSVTHAQNTDQRRVPLAVSQRGDTVSATLPSSLDTLPPGDYELTVSDTAGVPSAAQILTIRDGEPGLVTVAPTTAPDPAPGPGAPSPSPSVDMPMPSTGTGSAGAPATGAPAPGAPVTGSPSAPPADGGAVPAPPAPAPPAPSAPTPSTVLTLPVGRSIGVAPGTRTAYRVAHSGSTIKVAKASTRAGKALKRASSWIVRRGLGAKAGYSFESVDRPGWYLTAPAKGSGALKLAKASRSAAFAKRATFTAVVGLLKHDMSFRLSADPERYLRTDGSRLVLAGLPSTSSGRLAATFIVAKGLASRR